MNSQGSAASHINTWSSPSELRITDIRVATVVGAPMRCPILRMDTNQGIYGLGEVRDWASKSYALMLKRVLVGENPCDIDRLFRKIKQFGYHGRQGGGVSGVEMAIVDLAGKAYGVPAFMLLGGKFRDNVRCYCDTDSTGDASALGKRLKKRVDQGFTFLKMDLGIDLIKEIPGALSAPAGMIATTQVKHPFTGIRITDKGLNLLVEYAAEVRETIGYEIPLAIDHIGHLIIEDCVRLARAMDRFSFAWIEDMVPWEYTDQYERLSNSCVTPMATGEDIYCAEGFRDLFEKRAISVCHPDLATAGGIQETKRIGDFAERHGVAMALHMAGSPIACMAAVHAAAAAENFMVLENHSVDIPWWDDMVTGIDKPIIRDGYITVPGGPGLGVDFVEEVVREHLDPDDPGYFESTEYWDIDRSADRLWS